MNILFIASHLNTGGITTYLLTLSAGFIRRGHEVTVVAQDGDARERFEALGVVCVLKPIRVKSILHPSVYQYLPDIIQVVHERRIDVIHAQTRVTQVIGTLVSLITTVPLVTTAHGYFRPRLFRRLVGCWGKKVIAISQPVAHHLRHDFKIPDESIVCVRNGVDLVQFRPSYPERQRQYRATFGINAVRVIGCIARLSSVKGIDVMIKAFVDVKVRHPETLLLIVGEGPETHRLALQVQQLGLASHVRFIQERIKSEDILPVFDIIIAPSRMEGLGLSVMEAMACGVPVIASRVGGLVELIKDGYNGYLVEPEDAVDLATKINFMLDHYNQVQGMAGNARHIIASDYNSEQMISKTLDVYTTLTVQS